MNPEYFRVSDLTAEEWDEFTDRLDEFEAPERMEEDLEKHREALEND